MPKAGQVSKEEHEQAHSWWEMIDLTTKLERATFTAAAALRYTNWTWGVRGHGDYRHEMPQ
jgi:hypothetical protein